MIFGLFRSKKREEKLRLDVQESFSNVKKDFNKVGEWIRHLDDKHGVHAKEIEELKDHLLDIQADLIEIKDFISFFGSRAPLVVSKQGQTARGEQTATVGVQTTVQTAVQTGILDKLTVMERGVVWALLNSDLMLSYEDLAALLGKDKSTIRGQINTIKQKAGGLIEEVREVSGKKRLHIPLEIKESILKSVKVRVKRSKKNPKSEK